MLEMAAGDNEKTLNLLILGPSGNGKSALGNAVLKKKEFKPSNNKSIASSDVRLGYGKHKDMILKVVDCTGVGSTQLDNIENQEEAIRCIEQAMHMNQEGYDAIILVERYGGRLLNYSRATINFFEDLFGTEFVKKNFIMVMTHGDNFERDQEDDESLTFEKWCCDQTGDFKVMMEKCGKRVVLFDNFTRDQVKMNDQIDGLIERVALLPKRGKIVPEQVLSVLRKHRAKQDMGPHRNIKEILQAFMYRNRLPLGLGACIFAAVIVGLNLYFYSFRSTS